LSPNETALVLRGQDLSRYFSEGFPPEEEAIVEVQRLLAKWRAALAAPGGEKP
jgi:hypothetical protein